MAQTPQTKPTLSLVVPVYNMETYLPDFLLSLERQEAPTTDFEVIFVDDGSVDGSPALLSRWTAEHPTNTRVVTQANGGLCAARNTGLHTAVGEWISFPDPDDILGDRYLEHVLDFIGSHAGRDVALVSTNIRPFETNHVTSTAQHPLAHRFERGTRTVDLQTDPDHFHLQSASGFYKRAEIERQGLTFDSRIKPHFEDAYFTALYLRGASKAPRLGILAEASYHYRRPLEGTSMVQTAWKKPEKYTTLIRDGYLGLLQQCVDDKGLVPRWIEYLVLYDYAWILRKDEEVHPPSAALDDTILDEFHSLSQSMLSLISDDAILSFLYPRPSAQQRLALLAIKGSPFPPLAAHETLYDAKHGLQRFRYFYQGPPPREEFLSNQAQVLPQHNKSRSVRYLGRELFNEQISWVDARRPISLNLNGVRSPILRGGTTVPTYTLEVKEPTARAGGPLSETWKDAKTGLGLLKSRELTLKAAAAETLTRLKDRYAMVLYRTPLMRRRYKDAWILIDRDNLAQDNAEHLYRYLRTERPDVNAFFVLSPQSADWKRLSEEGFRLIPIGSVRHLVALKNCAHLISSQVDHYIVRPLDRRRHGNGRWKFTFLQHGVTKDDCARWFNGKPIDLLVTATPDETASITNDGSPYVYTSKETKMTGFPRHDALLAKAEAAPPESRDTLLIMPSWRESLLKPAENGNHRTIRDDFWESEYVTNWLAVLRSDTLHQAAADSGLRVVFMPHPNMQPHLTADMLPSTVELRKYSDGDLQDALVRAKVAVTDYSSIIFDAAYIGASVAYFQFDRETFFDGSQPYQRGYFDYETQGFGPVSYTVGELVGNLERLVAGAPDQVYVDRVRRAFPDRDGHSCARVTQEIENL